MNKIKSNTDKTILTICTGFIIIYLLTFINFFVFASAVIGLIGVLSSYLSKKIEKFWFGLSKIMGLILPNILLSIIFFLILFPISQLSKIFRKKDLLRLKNQDETNYINVDKVYSKSSFLNPF